MSQILVIHQEDPQPRLIQQALAVLKQGGIIVYPTDSTYALGCQIADKEALERIRKLRQLDERHQFTLMCADIKEAAIYAQMDNVIFRTLKGLTPGPFTFILKATKETPKRLLHPKQKTIGIRIPEHKIAQMLLEYHHEPILSSTLMLPNEELPLVDPLDIQDRLAKQVDLILDGGNCGLELTTVVDCTLQQPQVVRQGKGLVP